MSLVEAGGGNRKELFGSNNVRFLGYNFLKNTLYEGEPVVPRIISEFDSNGKKGFYVENLPGMDLLKLVDDDTVTGKEKLRVIDHALGQLQAIDKAGIVLFDRAARNIRVLRYGSQGISTRQIDTESFYDKTGGGLYDGGELGWYFKPRVKHYEEKGFNLWCETTAELGDDVAWILRNAGEDGEFGYRFFERKYVPLDWGNYSTDYRNHSELTSKDVLGILRHDIKLAISSMRPERLDQSNLT